MKTDNPGSVTTLLRGMSCVRAGKPPAAGSGGACSGAHGVGEDAAGEAGSNHRQTMKETRKRAKVE